ncbi:putative vomeronasal receptor-like protein 4 [Mesocricetus auratus]|uniref:Vomeronasal type-1 receptor n=1 Tax=Mesocricetus auratus TaxID=10036 RepID=A0A1U7QNL5_MESAU|nr:putative vomeronasal receptor-like protein 4 [Mesocricetus auratus]
MVLQDCRVKPTELITCHLALVHIVMLLVALDFLSPDMFESLNLHNDFKCKILFYLSRVMRGLSICITCFLSVLQATTISPYTDWMDKIKHILTNYIIHIFLFFWSLNLSLSSNIILFTVAYSNTSQTNLLVVSKYCSLSPTTSIIKGLFFILTFSRDVFFVGLMLFSSVYMVLLLFWHHRRSQHLHRSSLSARRSPEQRATWTVLVLVSVFVVTYWMNLIISSHSRLLWRYDSVLLSLQKFVLNAYATACPVIQMTFQKRTHDMVRLMYWKYSHFITR